MIHNLGLPVSLRATVASLVKSLCPYYDESNAKQAGLLPLVNLNRTCFVKLCTDLVVFVLSQVTKEFTVDDGIKLKVFLLTRVAFMLVLSSVQSFAFER